MKISSYSMGINMICMTSNGLDISKIGSFLMCWCKNWQFRVHLTPPWDPSFYCRNPNFRKYNHIQWVWIQYVWYPMDFISERWGRFESVHVKWNTLGVHLTPHWEPLLSIGTLSFENIIIFNGHKYCKYSFYAVEGTWFK